MAARSNLDLQSLKINQENYIHLNALCEVCNKLTQQIVENSVFDRHNYQPDLHHGSIDGSKHGVKRQTAKARYGPKYFGLEKGVVALNMVLNGVPVNSKIIGANEHESHYSFDLCFNNDSGVKVDVISTDTAGSNQTSFLFFDIIDVQYAPCYRSIGNRVKGLCGFKSLDHYKHMLIKPAKKSNRQLIVREWPHLQQIMAALLMKDTTQSVIVKKLAAHENRSQLKKALWEYNRIHFSIYMLRYINDPILRRGVRIALNCGEGYNKIYNAVAKVGGKKFRGMSELEVEIWHQCTRLITLVIVYYNVHLLSQLIDKKLQQGDERAAQLLEKISPLAIRHINLGGIYNYDSESDGIDIDSIIATLNEALEALLAQEKKSRQK